MGEYKRYTEITIEGFLRHYYNLFKETGSTGISRKRIRGFGKFGGSGKGLDSFIEELEENNFIKLRIPHKKNPSYEFNIPNIKEYLKRKT